MNSSTDEENTLLKISNLNDLEISTLFTKTPEQHFNYFTFSGNKENISKFVLERSYGEIGEKPHIIQ